MDMKTKIIDAHTFIGSWSGINVSSTLQSLFASMEKAGVTRSVTITTNKDENEAVRKLVEDQPSKLHFGLWFLPDKEHLSYLRKHRDQIKMVKFHPSHAKTRFDDPKMTDLLRFCEQEDIPILVHCGRWREMAGYDIALSVAEKHEAKIILAHMGGVSPDIVKETVDAIQKRCIKNAYLMTSGMARSPDVYWLESCPPELILYATQGVGADRVILGSDYPFGKQEDMVKSVITADLSQQEREKILGKNAVRILHLE
jgi:predicted TIM-barrel fold metal-dependent hydrolase